MIKIVHIAKPIGGVGVYIHLLAKHLSKKEFENIVICNKEDNIIDLKDHDNKLIKHYHVKLLREISIINDLKTLQKIIKKLKVLQPDIIHCHSAKAGVLGRIAGNYLKIPTLYTPHAYSYLSSEKGLKRKVFKNIERKFKKYNSKTLACSLSEYKRTITDLEFPKDKVFVWNNSIPKINLPQIVTNYELPENFICSIGRPSYQKNTELLIKSIYLVKKQLKNIHLVILGVGLYSPLLKQTEELIEKLNLSDNITLIPWLKREESLAVVQKSKFVVSTSRYEGLPYAIIEALALSKPCILTNVDGNKDLVKNKENGYLVNENENEIATKIIKLYNDQEAIKKLSLASFKIFEENFEISSNIQNLEKIYKSLI